MSILNVRRIALAAAVIAAGALSASGAAAGMRVIDGTIAACSVAQTFGSDLPADGSLQIPVTDSTVGDFPDCGDVANPANRDPFSINYFGTTYSDFYLNDNGVLSFGGAITDDPSTPLLDLNRPAIAPFFGNVLLANQSNLRVGYELGPTAMWLNWLVEEEGGDGSINDFQLGIISQGGGDFDLIMNYIGIGWDPGQAGFTDGAGNGYVIAGAGVEGAYIGDDNGGPACTALSIACAIGVGAGQFGSDPEAGFYRFEFRNGVPVNVTLVSDVPLPAAPILFLSGMGAIAAVRRRKRV